jgi:hypothetical protein
MRSQSSAAKWRERLEQAAAVDGLAQRRPRARRTAPPPELVELVDQLHHGADRRVEVERLTSSVTFFVVRWLRAAQPHPVGARRVG